MHPINIFISYRRGDGAGSAGRIYELLKDQFHFFFDIDSIQLGERFHEKIRQGIGSSDFFLFIIGRNSTEEFQKRLSQTDYVVSELTYAVKRQVMIIPVLVDGALMPEEDCLPDSIGFITHLNAHKIDHVTFARDVMSLKKFLLEYKYPSVSPVSATSHISKPSGSSSWKESDLSELKRLLNNSNWEKANVETARLFLVVTNRSADGWLRARDIDSLSCSFIFTVDAIWFKYSGGLYGFTAQAQLIKDLGLNINLSKSFSVFSEATGWKESMSYKFIGQEGVYGSYPTPVVVSDSPVGVLKSVFQGLIAKFTSCRCSYE